MYKEINVHVFNWGIDDIKIRFEESDWKLICHVENHNVPKTSVPFNIFNISIKNSFSIRSCFKLIMSKIYFKILKSLKSNTYRGKIFRGSNSSIYDVIFKYYIPKITKLLAIFLYNALFNL